MSEGPNYRSHSTSAWTTYDELCFLDGLGTWRETGMLAKNKSKPRATTRLALLRGYKAGLALRQTWGHLNDMEIRAHLETLLAQET
jgi:hypothetical protein